MRKDIVFQGDDQVFEIKTDLLEWFVNNMPQE